MALSDIEYNYWLTAEYDWTDENSPDSETGSEITWCVSTSRFDITDDMMGDKIAIHPLGAQHGMAYVNSTDGYVYAAGTILAWIGSNSGLENDSYPGHIGFNEHKHLGENRFYKTNINIPNIKSIRMGGAHILILQHDGTLWSMGANGGPGIGAGDSTHMLFRDYNYRNQHRSTVSSHVHITGALGTGKVDDEFDAPVKVVGGTDVVDMKAGEAFSVFLKSDGSVWGTGYNYGYFEGKFSGWMGKCYPAGYWFGKYAELTPFEIVPAPELGEPKVIAMDNGTKGSLLIKDDGSIWTFSTYLGHHPICKEPYQLVVKYSPDDEQQLPNGSVFMKTEPDGSNIYKEGAPVGNRVSGKVSPASFNACAGDPSYSTHHATKIPCGGDGEPPCVFGFEKDAGQICEFGYSSYNSRGVCDGYGDGFDDWTGCSPYCSWSNIWGNNSFMEVDCEPGLAWRNKNLDMIRSVRQVVEPTTTNPVTQVFLDNGQFAHFIRHDGSFWAMGENHYGQLGIPEDTDSGSSKQISTIYTGGVGNHREGYIFVDPVEIPQFKHKVKKVVSSILKNQTWFLLKDGTVWSCGAAWSGALGHGNPEEQNNAGNYLPPSESDHEIGGPKKIEIDMNGDVFDGVIDIYATSELNEESQVFYVKSDGSIWKTGGTGQLGTPMGTGVGLDRRISGNRPVMLVSSPMDECEEIEEFANHKIVPPEGSTYKLMPGQTWKYTIRPWDGHNMFGNKAFGWKKTSTEITIPIQKTEGCDAPGMCHGVSVIVSADGISASSNTSLVSRWFETPHNQAPGGYSGYKKTVSTMGYIQEIAGENTNSYGGAEISRFNTPGGVGGIAAAADGTVYVTDSASVGCVWKCTPPIDPTEEKFTCVKLDGEFVSPRGIAVDVGGAVYVATSSQLWKITTSGEKTIIEGGFVSITRIKVTTDGTIYLIDRGVLWRILPNGPGKWKAKEQVMRYTPSVTRDDGSFVILPLQAYDVALDLNDNLYVSALGWINKWIKSTVSLPLNMDTPGQGGDRIAIQDPGGSTTLSVDGDGNIFYGTDKGPPRVLRNKTKNLDTTDPLDYEEDSYHGYNVALPCHGYDNSGANNPGNDEHFGVDCCPWYHSAGGGSRLIVECPPISPTDPK